MDRMLRGLHKNDSTAQVGEFSKLFFKKIFMAFEPKLLIYLIKRHFPSLEFKGTFYWWREHLRKTEQEFNKGLWRNLSKIPAATGCLFFFLPKNFVDLRKIYMFLASVIMEQENAAVEINWKLKK